MSNTTPDTSTSPAAPRKKKRKKKSVAASPVAAASAGNGASGRPQGGRKLSPRKPPSKVKLACATALGDAAKALRRGGVPDPKILSKIQRCCAPKG